MHLSKQKHGLHLTKNKPKYKNKQILFTVLCPSRNDSAHLSNRPFYIDKNLTILSLHCFYT